MICIIVVKYINFSENFYSATIQTKSAASLKALKYISSFNK